MTRAEVLRLMFDEARKRATVNGSHHIAASLSGDTDLDGHVWLDGTEVDWTFGIGST